MISLVWTKQAINSGGKLTVEQMLPHNGIVRARMDWPGEVPVTGAISLSIDGALKTLEHALMLDAADEMQRAGAV